jgi:hypothetical protein
MISLPSVAVSLSVGLLMQYAHGYVDPTQYREDPDLVVKIEQVNYWEKLVDYCFDHADRPNPLQDLRDKGFSVIGSDCKSVKQTYDEQLGLQNKMIANFTKNYPCAHIDPTERQYYPHCSVK